MAATMDDLPPCELADGKCAATEKCSPAAITGEGRVSRRYDRACLDTAWTPCLCMTIAQSAHLCYPKSQRRVTSGDPPLPLGRHGVPVRCRGMHAFRRLDGSATVPPTPCSPTRCAAITSLRRAPAGAWGSSQGGQSSMVQAMTYPDGHTGRMGGSHIGTGGDR